MIYLIICLFIILLVYIEVIDNSKLSSAFYGGIVCITMVLFASLRDKVGTDWEAYYDFYIYQTSEVEIGYAAINNFSSYQGLHYNIFLFFLNFVSISLLYISLRKFAIFFVISLLLYYSELFLYFNFSGIRQGIAISITIYAIQYSINRNFMKFLLLVVLGATFHITSLIFIFAYFIPFRNFNKKEVFFIATIFILLSIFIYTLIDIFTGELAYKVKYYLEIQENDPNLKNLFIIGSIKRVIIIGMVFIFGKEVMETKNGIYFFNIYVTGYAMYLSTYLISPDVGVRLSSYFLIFDIFLAGNLILVNQKLTTRLIIVTLFSIEAIYKTYTYMIIEPYIYHNILSNY